MDVVNQQKKIVNRIKEYLLYYQYQDQCSRVKKFENFKITKILKNFFKVNLC